MGSPSKTTLRGASASPGSGSTLQKATSDDILYGQLGPIENPIAPILTEIVLDCGYKLQINASNLANQFRWDLISRLSNTIASSYSSFVDVESAAEHLQESIALAKESIVGYTNFPKNNPAKFEIYPDELTPPPEPLYKWRFVAPDGTILAIAETSFRSQAIATSAASEVQAMLISAI